SLRALHGEVDLPVAVAKRHQVTFVAPVEEAWPRVLLHLALPMGHKVETVEIDFEGLVAGLVALLAFLDDVRLSGSRQQRRQHVLVRIDLVGDCTRIDDARPPDRAGYAPAAIPVRVLLAAERRYPAVRP